MKPVQPVEPKYLILALLMGALPGERRQKRLENYNL